MTIPGRAAEIQLGARSREQPETSPRVSPDESDQQRKTCEGFPIFYSVVAIAMLAVFGVVFAIQYKQWDTNVDTYQTNDPNDIVRNGLTYFCGCDLPPALQAKQNPQQSAGPGPGVNVCYDPRRLEDVVVLMFSNGSAATAVEPLIKAAPVYRTYGDGYLVAQQGHELSGPISMRQEIKSLYPYNYTQIDDITHVDYLIRDELLDFPSSYLRFAFRYNCTNCSTCDVSFLNDTIKLVANEPWGDCFYYGDASNECGPGQNTSYLGKCVLYQTTAIPPNFAVERFIQLLFTKFSDVVQIRPATDDNYSYLNYISLQPNSLYMNFSEAVSSPISLGFLEVEKGSAPWLALLGKFPTLENGCLELPAVEVCSGTSVCSVSRTGHSYATSCLDMQSRSLCRTLMDNWSSVDQANNLWPIYTKVRKDDHISLACPSFECVSEKARPYFVLWKNDSQKLPVFNDSFNEFLFSRVLDDQWAQRSGVCTNTYKGVLRLPPHATPWNNIDIFLQAKCTSNSTTNFTQERMNNYCWLTGLYHNLTDVPEEGWRNLTRAEFPESQGLFLCYRVVRMSKFHWFVVSFGIASGWMSLAYFPSKISRKLWKKISESQGEPGQSKIRQKKRYNRFREHRSDS